MKNYVQRGDVLNLVAPYALTSGDGLLVGGIFAVASVSVANGMPVEAATVGVYDLAALNTDVGAVGAKAYWDNTNRRITLTATGNTPVGVLTRAKASGEALARVRLSGAF